MLVGSVEHDHLDIYPDEASYLRAFEGFTERLAPEGLLAYWAADPLAAKVVQGAPCRLVPFARSVVGDAEAEDAVALDVPYTPIMTLPDSGRRARMNAADMVRLARQAPQVVVDRILAIRDQLAAEGATPAHSLEALVDALRSQATGEERERILSIDAMCTRI